MVTLDQIATDHWKATAHQTISIAYRASENAGKSPSDTRSLARDLWQVERDMKTLVSGLYDIFEKPRPASEPATREEILSTAQTLTQLHESGERIFQTSQRRGFLNNGVLALPVRSIRTQAEEVLGFANWLRDAVSEETESLFQRAEDEHSRAETLSFEEAIKIGPSR